MRRHINMISVFETICKPYITATIVVMDNNNVINGMGDLKGEKISFVIDTGIGKLYESVQHVLSISDPEEQPDNLRTKKYTIEASTEGLFNDRSSIVQRSDVNIPITQAAAQIHSEYVGDAPLKILMNSMGMIAKTDIGGFITANKKPFKAIRDMIERASYGNYKTGSTVYFRDAKEYVMAPLEHLFATMSSQAEFIEKQTWGSDWRDTFNAFNAIIVASSVVKEGQGQQAGAANLAAANKGAVSLFDVTQGKEVLMQAAQQAQSIGNQLTSNLGKFSKGKFGGMPNVLQMDTRRNETSNEQGMNIVQQNMFQAQLKDSVNYYIKVPIQGGINVTVGKGFTAKLLPPVGDLNMSIRSRIGGLMLACDVHHECYFDQRERQATTNIRGVQINYND